jgi:uncharacterized ion transporter superfamily protein YfcC
MSLFSELKVPNTLVLAFSFMLLMGLLTWLIPAGEFDRVEKNGRKVVVPHSFHEVASQPQGVGAILRAPLKGFMDAAEIIGLILIVGGAFGIVNATGAIEAGIRAATRRIERSTLLRAATIPLLVTLFSLGGASFGMSEESLAFALIFIPFARALGYDSIVGIAIPLVGTGVGFGAAFTNPFTVGIAQGIAELPPFSGIEYRLVAWAVLTAAAVIFIKRYAVKIKKHPEKSPVYQLDHIRDSVQTVNVAAASLSKAQMLVIVIFLFAIAALVVGAVAWEWSMTETSALFLAMGILAGRFGRLKANQTAEAFIAGAKDLMLAALIVGFSRGILVIARDGKIIDTILASLCGFTASAHPVVSAYLMLAAQTCINFFVPSGSGQAALTMPIMAPLSDLLGITRQTAVLIFQFGNSFSDLVIPTSGVTMGVLGIAKIPFEKWVRWALPLVALFYAAGLILIAIPVLFGWGPH